MFRIKLLFIILLLPFAALAQQPDTTDTPGRRESGTPGNDTLRIYSPLTVTLINERSMNSDSLVTHPIDTSINKFQNYSEFYRNDDYYVNLGNLGLAARNLLTDFDKGIGFRTGQRALDIYQYDKSKLDYYRTRSPYTELYYVSGGRPEQIFRFIHTQNIKPRLNAGVEYRKIGSEGYYPNQNTNHLNLAAFTWYQSENLRYNLIGNIVYTDLRAPENGGLVNDSIFEIPSNEDQILQERVFLEDARTRWRGTAIYLKQYYNIGRVDRIDTGKTYAEKVYPHQRVSHSIYLENRSYTYQDKSGNPSYYYFIYNSEPNPLDSIHYRNIENEFTLSVFGRTGQKQRAFSKAAILQAGIKHRLVSYAQGPIDTTFNVLSLKGQAGYQLSEKLGIIFNGERVFLGPYDGDVTLSADARLFISENIGEIRLGGLYQRKRPEFMFENYYSSYHRWEQDYERINLSQLSFSYYHDKLKLGLSGEYSLISNYTFFRGRDNYVVPYQFTGEMDILKVTLEKDLNFLKNFVFSGHLVYQYSNYRNILLTPEAYAYGSLFYRNKLFGVLDFQLGVDVRYFTETEAYSYAPELGRFFVDDNAKTIGDYPIVDLFLTADLRRTRFLVKFDHANQGFPERGYYTVKRYPMPNRTLKFGISWRFYD
ncbi:putative beta-barrel porin [Anseongella ginsenosidimutans]|uniref:Putative beta-barrel porin n=1 Tax=Anseongella ginsenosidimutans TaxID=496056 RepID=A0A4R3KPE3_9SPHI|nr:putative porin [Anseongella ginsenosidimutans]QEC52619.1 hypothetical protein FRZ59_09905 [Anseongella ginsenosidimutans]TCS86542.1 putative beta-barrel porin [Anseongella ginsenosidimutans]